MATTPINSPQHGQERLSNFFAKYPRSKSLKIQPVQAWGDQGANGGLADGFDIDDVKGALGPARFALLLTTVKEVFVCGHRTWPANHAEISKRNGEVHCIFASDLENFLKAGH